MLFFLECDNCAQTLLHDLEELDDELGKLKAQLDNATASSSFQDRMKKLEKALSDTKVTRQCSVALHSQSAGCSNVTKWEEPSDCLEFVLCTYTTRAHKQWYRMGICSDMKCVLCHSLGFNTS